MKSKVKSMLIIFFDIKGIVLIEFILQAKQSILHTAVTFTATVGRCAKNLPQTLMTEELAVASQQYTISLSFFTREFFLPKTT
jgi:hypothetical protein